MKESKAMAKKEISFMEKKGAPKSMIKHEMAEEMCGGGKVKKMAVGGMPGAPVDPRLAAMKGARRRPAMPGGMPGLPPGFPGLPGQGGPGKGGLGGPGGFPKFN